MASLAHNVQKAIRRLAQGATGTPAPDVPFDHGQSRRPANSKVPDLGGPSYLIKC